MAAVLTRYEEVARALREEIARGTHPIGSLLPSEVELGQRFAVSRHTVRVALRLLREERLLSSRQGRGSEVTAPGSAEAFRLEANSIDDLMAYSSHMYTQIEASGLELIDGRTAARLGVTPGERWLVVRGLAHSQRRRTPVCGSIYYINGRFAALEHLLPRNSGPLFLLIEELFGVSIAEMDQTISAGTLATPLAETLGANPGDTSIEVRRSFRTGNGTLAQVSLHTHPAARFQQTVRMRRLRD